MTAFVSLTNMTISNGGLTAVAATNAFANARADVAGDGKAYFEVKLDTVAASGGVGIANTTENSFCGGSTNSFGVGQDGNVYKQSFTYVTNFSSALAANDVLQFAMDIPNKLIWIKRNVEAWNPFFASADPNTGVNGLDTSSVAGLVFPYFDCTASGWQSTLNVGGSAYFGTRPTGFVDWADILMPQGIM